MLGLLRRIQKEELVPSGLRKYIAYAIGEIALVVLGILIALQINNWNEDRIEQRQIADYARALIKDLERDVRMVAIIGAEINVLMQKIDTLSDYVAARDIENMRNIDLYYLMRAPFYRPYSWNRTALEQIKSSGALRQMRNQELAAKISAYEAFTHHLEGDFEFDRAVGIRAVAMASTVVNMNYPGIQRIFPSKSPSTFSFPDSPVHVAFEETHLSLLTSDIKDIAITVNQYLILGGYYGIRPRADTEIQKVADDAKELITSLREEYPE
jgi:hypothetical protein